MKAKTALVGAALVAASAFAGSAMAQGYIGGSVGQSDADIDCAGTLTCDNKDTAFKLYGGYMFMPYVGVEAAYFDLGKAKATFTDTVLGNVSADFKASGYALYGVAAAPINDFVLFGKLGFASIKTKLSANSSNFGAASDSETKTNVAWGVGAGYYFVKNVGVRLEWERFRAEFQGEKTDIDVISLGAHYRF